MAPKKNSNKKNSSDKDEDKKPAAKKASTSKSSSKDVDEYNMELFDEAIQGFDFPSKLFLVSCLLRVLDYLSPLIFLCSLFL